MTSANEAEAETATPAVRPWQPLLRWFLGEFTVVVAGVLVALAMGAWWQERDDRERERAYLGQLMLDLADTETEMADASQLFTSFALASAQVTQAYWQQPRPSLSSLADAVALPLRSRRHRPSLGTINALVASGDLGLVRSAQLRTELIAYADWSHARMDDAERFDETYFRPGVAAVSPDWIDALRKPLAVSTVMQLRPSPALLRVPPSGTPPFAVDDAAFFGDLRIYSAYSNLLTAHRGTASQYSQILASARRLRTRIHHELHGKAEPGNCLLADEGAGEARQLVGSCGEVVPGAGALALFLRLESSGIAGVADAKGVDLRYVGTASLAGGASTPATLEVDLFRNGTLRTTHGDFSVTVLTQESEDRVIGFRLGAITP